MVPQIGDIKLAGAEMDRSFELTTSTKKSIPADSGLDRAEHSPPNLESADGEIFENQVAENAAAQECGPAPATTPTFSTRDGPDNARHESKFTDNEERTKNLYTIRRRIKISGLLAVTMTTWSLLLLPVVIYYIPSVSEIVYSYIVTFRINM